MMPKTTLVQLAEEFKELRDETFQWWVQQKGAHVAAWLIRSFKSNIHHRGEINFSIPASKETPPWFRVGFEKLRQSNRWETSITREIWERTYRVKWKQWKSFTLKESN